MPYLSKILYCYKHAVIGKWNFRFSDLVCSMKRKNLSVAESNEISSFLERAFVRLESWFQWFNTTQSGQYGFYLLFSFPYCINLNAGCD